MKLLKERQQLSFTKKIVQITKALYHLIYRWNTYKYKQILPDDIVMTEKYIQPDRVKLTD